MNVLERWKAVWTDKRITEMREEHDKELQYMAVRHNRQIEVMTREIETLRRQKSCLIVGMESLLQSQGGGDDTDTTHGY
jgi:hypothetical protein